MLPNLEPVLLKQEGTTLIATISRPDAMNALNAAVLKSLSLALGWIKNTKPADIDIRALVITGAGEKAFVAGADIREFVPMTPSSAHEFAAMGQKLFTSLEELSIPVIAAVNGFALGGGLELALACDFIYASDNAKFGLPECTLGLMPGFGGTVRLPRRVGPGRAREMSMTGAMISADEALKIGLVNRVCPQGELMSAALETAKTIGLRAPIAVGKIKKSIHEGASLTESEANALEAKLFGELFATADKTEGVNAFIEKRKPQFKGT